MAKGTTESGETIMVYGGDLSYGETIEVDFKEESNQYINSKINYESIDIFKEHFDKDGLVEFKKLKEVKHKSTPLNRVYELDNKYVFPNKNIKHQIEYLYDKNLISESKIKISESWWSVKGRAPVYGVNYIELIEKVIKNGEPISSWFICEREKDFNKGVYADLFVLGNLSESEFQIQLWQIIGEGSELLYAHGLLNKNNLNFTHFDLASHYIDPDLVPKLIYGKQKLKLTKKVKWLRIDNGIDKQTAFDLIKMFFPMDYLVNEFLENPVQTLSNKCHCCVAVHDIFDFVARYTDA